MRITKDVCRNCPGSDKLPCKGDATCIQVSADEFLSKLDDSSQFSEDVKCAVRRGIFGNRYENGIIMLHNAKYDFFYLADLSVLQGKDCINDRKLIMTQEQAEAVKRKVEKENPDRVSMSIIKENPDGFEMLMVGAVRIHEKCLHKKTHSGNNKVYCCECGSILN